MNFNDFVLKQSFSLTSTDPSSIFFQEMSKPLEEQLDISSSLILDEFLFNQMPEKPEKQEEPPPSNVESTEMYPDFVDHSDSPQSSSEIPQDYNSGLRSISNVTFKLTGKLLDESAMAPSPLDLGFLHGNQDLSFLEGSSLFNTFKGSQDSPFTLKTISFETPFFMNDSTINVQVENGTAVASKIVIDTFELSSLNGSNGFTLFGVSAGDRAGWSVSSAGDINGDGFDDVVVGAYLSDVNGTESGQSYVVFGQASSYGASFELSSLNGTNGFTINGIGAGDQSGISVSSAGDVNGDGYDDIIIGGYLADPNGTSSGESYVVFGQAGSYGASFDLSSFDGTNGFVMNGISGGDGAGFSVSSAGDVNGDGFDDLIVGAYGTDAAGVPSSGQSYVVFGQAGGHGGSFDLSSLNGTNGFMVNGISVNDQSGWFVSSVGDVNGDGFDDVSIGAYRADPNGSESGQSYVVFGKAGGYGSFLDLSSLNGTNGFAINGITAGDRSGISISSAGDMNGDGYDDMILGAYQADPNGTRSGQSYVVFGKAGGYGASFELSSLDGSNGFMMDGIKSNDSAGYSVSSAGDFNGDGFDDVIVGAYGADPNGNLTGQSYVVFGKAEAYESTLDFSSLNGINGLLLNGVEAEGEFGVSVSSAGDINGDGFDDLIAGAYGAESKGYETGESYVIFGGDQYSTNSFLSGTSGDDTLTGTSNVDSIIGNQGNDTIYSQGGADVIYGASGDDTVYVTDANFFKVDGGSGEDTLVWDNGGSFDLTALDESALENFEGIDLSNNTGDLVLDALDVLNLSDTSNTLRVDGDADNTVTLQGGGWIDTGARPVDGGQTYAVYSQGEAVVEIDTDVVVVI